VVKQVFLILVALEALVFVQIVLIRLHMAMVLLSLLMFQPFQSQATATSFFSFKNWS